MGLQEVFVGPITLDGALRCTRAVHESMKERGHANLRVNAIAPSRLEPPKDMDDARLFPLSDAAAWITGRILAVDGGQIIRA